jgi:hypothetical protein
MKDPMKPQERNTIDEMRIDTLINMLKDHCDHDDLFPILCNKNTFTIGYALEEADTIIPNIEELREELMTCIDERTCEDTGDIYIYTCRDNQLITFEDPTQMDADSMEIATIYHEIKTCFFYD